MGAKSSKHLNPPWRDSLDRRSFLKVGALGSVLLTGRRRRRGAAMRLGQNRIFLPAVKEASRLIKRRCPPFRNSVTLPVIDWSITTATVQSSGGDERVGRLKVAKSVSGMIGVSVPPHGLLRDSPDTV